METFNINLEGRTEKECKVIKRLVLDFRTYESNLKYFKADELVNEFINSDFYSSKLEYDALKKRCYEYMVDEYSKC